jgi:hypothetical protein
MNFRATSIAFIAFALCGVAHAQAPTLDHSHDIQILGSAGLESCARWLSTPALKREGDIWIWGYWSGRTIQSLADRGTGQIGLSTDAEGIAGEVERNCRYAPSQKLLSVVGNVYTMFSNNNR